ncbi:family 16 glycoside hydrolase [Paenibacillus sp. Soil750]|uniref:family 16 glycoside hydrolase n=1 Tax=Paenibacillus sp. Soil750 TaxID=1736398 RepID=UPI000700528E|nr:family 16 glycoside hydrolase [Paenibacillus sp. Soil750]KRE58038.1 hypothetical protein ASL11_30975 [Paenibacillus sp. Soil750]
MIFEASEPPVSYNIAMTSQTAAQAAIRSICPIKAAHLSSKHTDGDLILRQQVTEEQIPIDWKYRRTPEPYTLFGSLEWTNYRLSVEVQLEQQAGYIGLGGRISYTSKSNEPPEGYWLRMRHTGRYELMKGKYPLLQGDKTALVPNEWYALELAFEGKTVKAHWNGVQLFEHADSEISSGHAALLSSYHRHAFRNLRIEPIRESAPVDCIRYLNTHAALHYSGDWDRADGDWNVYARTLAKSGATGAALSFRFKGEAASIVGKKCADGGFFDIYLNGAYQGTVDTYRPQTGFRKSLYTAIGLDPHTETEIRLVVKEMRHPESADTHVYINAVEVVAGQLIT